MSSLFSDFLKKKTCFYLSATEQYLDRYWYFTNYCYCCYRSFAHHCIVLPVLSQFQQENLFKKEINNWKQITVTYVNLYAKRRAVTARGH